MVQSEAEIEALMDSSRDAYCRGDFERALVDAERGLALLGQSQGEVADELRVRGCVGVAAALLEYQEAERALEYLRRVHELEPGDGEAMYFEARARLQLGEIDAAEDLLARCEPPDVLRGTVVYHRAMVADARGCFDEADELYAEAERLDPDCCPRPVRMAEDEARELLADLVRSFPADVRGALDNIRIEMADMPDPKIDWGATPDPFLLGLYDGVPIGDLEDVSVGMPGSVRIFKRNIERLATDDAELREQLRITLLHEVGHHLGWDEDDLAERGLA